MDGSTGGERGLKLFGVRIVDGDRRWREERTAAVEGENEEAVRKSMLKSKSMGNLAACAGSPAGEKGAGDHGYLSDGGLVQSSRGRAGHERKRGVPWTEEEHLTFLAGLEKLGKGDWRGISRNFVTTRTPTQVASHAQKYFLRQSNPNKKKRRSSLFDVVISNRTTSRPETPSSPLKTSDKFKKVDRLSLDNYSAASPSFTLIQPGSSIAASCTGNQNLILTDLSVNSMTFVPGEAVSSFVKLSIPLSSPPPALPDSPTIANSDLELSIAPPESHSSLGKISSGTIRVV
ncbi:Transcription factor DIVARICATA [Apostasia shenzhenica]|uniref:Transcription factor DIVARICATA n=1 Tax=Apostasia shenzhenica TaxID=1088818 RepID=A0A2I0A420_9ASPA|nr:Transcription factor DIVARICATA [Apostasia shenzhenica]